MLNIYFCICKTLCFAQVYVFAYAKVYTLYKTYSFAYAKYKVLQMYMVCTQQREITKQESEGALCTEIIIKKGLTGVD